MWIFASLPDLKRVLKAGGASLGPIALLALDRSAGPVIPRWRCTGYRSVLEEYGQNVAVAVAN